MTWEELHSDGMHPREATKTFSNEEEEMAFPLLEEILTKGQALNLEVNV